MKTRSDRHPLIPVATTPEEFDACCASGTDGERLNLNRRTATCHLS